MSPIKTIRIKAIFVFMIITSICCSVWGDDQAISLIRWRGEDLHLVIAFIVIICVGLVILFFLNFQTKTKDKKNLEGFSENLFNDNVKKTELTSAEVIRLKELLRHSNTAHQHVIFQSAPLFENCIDTEVRSLIQQNLTPEQILAEELILSNLRKKLGYNFLPYEHPLISTRNLEIGQKMTVYGRKHESPLIQNARVIQNREFNFKLQYDPEHEEAGGILEGQTLVLAFARSSDGVYGINTVVNKCDYSSSIEFLHTMELRRNQLREYVRIEVNLQSKLRVVKSDSEESKLYIGKTFEARMSDISGGGACVVLSKPLIPGDIVVLNFQLSTGPFAGVAAKVLRVSLQEVHDTKIYKHSLQFFNLDQNVREKIVKYVFEKQRQANQWR